MKEKIATFIGGIVFTFMWVGLPIVVGIIVETIVK